MEDFNKYTSHINYSPIVDFVLQQGKQTYYKKGDYFSRQGEVCKTMGFVSSGSFRYCCTNSVGENSIVGYTFDHSFVGNYPAFQLQDQSNVDWYFSGALSGFRATSSVCIRNSSA